MEIKVDVYIKYPNGYSDIRHETVTEDDIESLFERKYTANGYELEVENINVTHIVTL